MKKAWESQMRIEEKYQFGDCFEHQEGENIFPVNWDHIEEDK